ncbi:hypothetical protein P692DRAFT_20881320 [Suillus brevipes Sb2]|nr:hypothetical protein P692DRAFT_20881320 [Suillus brevipes Sb2]
MDQCQCFHLPPLTRFLTSSTVRDYEGTWEKLSQVAVKGAEYDSRERQPHPQCLEGTRVDLLKYIYGSLDDREKSRLIWLHGTAGVGKSAVAFSVAERMRGLKVTEESKERRLAGTFFFSRKHTKRRTTGFFFATLAYQIASNFSSVREDVNQAIRENPALLDPDKSLRDQMEALFLRPLRRLRFRLRECPPLAFIVDALDECSSENELADLISLLGQALRDPDLPVTHILLTSRSENHIRKAMHTKDVCPLVCEIPVKVFGEGVAATISLDGVDVDNDIYIFLQHSFRELQTRHCNFPQPTEDELARLASRAGRRFIVASTMMKFVDDGYNDPRNRLQLMLELTSNLLPGTEVYKLYDLILSTCAHSARAFLHLSVVAALADPLPLSQISELLGPGQGRDVETVLVQLRSVMDVPTDSTLPVTISHSSVRDYVSDPSNCSLPEVQPMTPPHSLLAYSSLRLMIQNIPDKTALLDSLSDLKRKSRAMQRHHPKNIKDFFRFIVQPPKPLQVLIGLLWLRGDHSPDLQCWLDTLDGQAWLQAQEGNLWLGTREGLDWVSTLDGIDWLRTQGGMDWLRTQGGRDWQNRNAHPYQQPLFWRIWLVVQGRRWRTKIHGMPEEVPFVMTEDGRRRVDTTIGQEWLQTVMGRDWLRSFTGQQWLGTPDGRKWLKTQSAQSWLLSFRGQDWLQTENGREWLWTPSAREWLRIASGRQWLWTYGGQQWLWTTNGREWLLTPDGREWLWTNGGQEWLQTQGGRDWLQIPSGREWLQTERGREWLQTPHGQAWQLTAAASVWVTMKEFSNTLETITKFNILPKLALQPTFQVIQIFKNLPDLLLFSVFLAFSDEDYSDTQDDSLPNMEIIHSMLAFENLAHQARKRNPPGSAALDYACHNWAFHLLRAPKAWDDTLDHTFTLFWDNYLLSWLERQWCQKGLQSSLVVLSEGQQLQTLRVLKSRKPSILRMIASRLFVLR